MTVIYCETIHKTQCQEQPEEDIALSWVIDEAKGNGGNPVIFLYSRR